jgi:radical SAM protein with 4Fe4S-binding SPASM domain
MGVFHVALGGGEALAREDLFEIAAHARAVGLVPNLTVSGALMTPEVAARMEVFGQVNVSIDGVGEPYGVYRDGTGFAAADAALGMLVAAGVPAGINCVVGRTNFGAIRELFEYASRAGANEIEFLRLKPAGRGGGPYRRDRTDHHQNLELFPMLQRLSDEHGVTAKVDCSFLPMVCEHRPPADYLEATGTYGCVAGNVLLGARSDGSLAGCSFLPPLETDVFSLAAAWDEHPELERLRSWPQRAPEPCRSCEYLEICRGGCRAVAAFAGDPDGLDPDCPRVVRYRQERR